MVGAGHSTDQPRDAISMPASKRAAVETMQRFAWLFRRRLDLFFGNHSAVWPADGTDIFK
ncbi:hypothetical protein REMIM1_PF00582 (plasmid) [Rhizobium etli bv. mimosae str. Mim1]|nr:hypothetical protein REMIM1_PF00582 [Rhizobium etli bv. mimosae str. Mim1]